MLACAAHKEQPSTALRERFELSYTKAAQVSAKPLVIITAPGWSL